MLFFTRHLPSKGGWMILCFTFIITHTQSQQLPFQYDKIEFVINADFIAYGQHNRALHQEAKLRLLNNFITHNSSETVCIFLDYPNNLEELIQECRLSEKSKTLERYFYKTYKSKSYAELQYNKTKEIIEIAKQHKNVLIKCVGETNEPLSDSVLFRNIKSVLAKEFYKSILITSTQHISKYYYPDENFYGNKLSAVCMLYSDTLFHDKTILSIAEESRMIEKPNHQGLTKTIAYWGFRNYQRDRINLIPYKNETYLFIDLWEYLAEYNLTTDYLVLYNEMMLNK